MEDKRAREVIVKLVKDNEWTIGTLKQAGIKHNVSGIAIMTETQGRFF